MIASTGCAPRRSSRMHLACLGVLWVGVSRHRARGRRAAVRAAHVRHHRLLSPLLRAPHLPHLARGAVPVRLHRRLQRAARTAVVGRPSPQPPSATPIPQRDPHSPRVHGFLWSHMGWFLTRQRLSHRLEARFRTWRAIPELRWLDRYDILVPVAARSGPVRARRPAAPRRSAPAHRAAAQLLVWGFFVSTVVLFHATVTINSLAHRFGTRRFDTRDDSRNNLWLALLTFGEGWHNNHHFFPGSVRQGFRWWEIDLTYYGLRLTGRCWAWCYALKPVPGRVLAQARACMRIAVIGSGIAGLASAWLLSRAARRDAVRGQRLSGRPHAHPRRRRWTARSSRSTRGFIVYNERHYPLLTRLFAELGVRIAADDHELLGAQRRQRPGVQRDHARHAVLPAPQPALAALLGHAARPAALLPRGARAARRRRSPVPTLGEYLARACATAPPSATSIWCRWPRRCGPRRPRASWSFPAQYLVRFMANHHMLQLRGRAAVARRARRLAPATWARCARAGSVRRAPDLPGASRCGAMPAACSVDQRAPAPSASTRSCSPATATRRWRCSPTPSEREREILGAIAYQANEVVLHTDASLLPRNRKAWAAWNACIPAHAGASLHGELLHESAAGRCEPASR